METFKEFCAIILVVAVVLAALVGVIVVIDNVFGFADERAQYKAKCEASGGVVYKPRDEPKRCMKKEFFIQMDK